MLRQQNACKGFLPLNLNKKTKIDQLDKVKLQGITTKCPTQQQQKQQQQQPEQQQQQ